MTDNGRAALWLLLAATAAAALVLLVRSLTPAVSIWQIVFVRCAGGFVLLLPLVLAQGLPPLPRHGPLHLLRGGLAWLAITGSFYAFSRMPLAAATVLLCTTPLFVTLLRSGWLQEPVGWRCWSATVLGSSGAVLLLGTAVLPGLIALGSAALLAVTLLLSQRLAATQSPTTLLFYFGLVTTLASLPAAWLAWRWPNLTDGLLLLLVASCAALRSVCELRGYWLGAARLLTVLPYTRIVLVGGGAWLLFAETPTTIACLGTVLIVTASIYSSHCTPR